MEQVLTSCTLLERRRAFAVPGRPGSGSVLAVGTSERLTVWELLRQYAATQSGPFTSQEALSWFRRHAPSQANDRTVRTHLRGASCNVGDRSQFTHREPFLTRVDRGVFRRATEREVQEWRAEHGDPKRRSAEPERGPESPDQQGSASPPQNAPKSQAPRPSAHEGRAGSEWHTEARVQSGLIAVLVNEGWRILSVANTATKEHGIDVVAARGDQTVGFEVKGFPTRRYADPARAAETKRTAPSTQAGHWYAQAVLAAMRLRSKEPTWHSVIVLPDFPRYRELHSQTAGSLAASQIEVWWIEETGALHRP